MWKLINAKKEHIEHYLIVGEEVIVGRKDANLLITNDPSISRKHAILYVKHLEENVGDPSKPASLFLRDQGSKYGTFKNGVRVSAEIELKNDDIVKFGQFESEYRVCKIPLVVTTSCLDISGKRELRKIIHSLGGHFVSEWQPLCTHLVMSEVKVTIKAVCCLCSAKPIVKPEYFSNLKNSLKSSTFIQPNQYIPPIGEALIDKETVSFDVNIVRKELFKEKNFFFLDEKQFKKLHLGIVLGGGNASILPHDQIISEVYLQDSSCIIEPVQGPSQEQHSLFEKVISSLQSKKLRMIPESDVGLAVAYCSIEKFCNPAFNMGDAVLQNSKLQSQTLTQREVYVPDTQARLISEEINKNVSDAGNSLNFSTFRADPMEDMDISEIPLSDQVKKELADIFDEPMEDEIEIFNELNSRLSNSLEKTRKLKQESPVSIKGETSGINQKDKLSLGRRKELQIDTTQTKTPKRSNSTNGEMSVKPEESSIRKEPEEQISLSNGRPDKKKNGIHQFDLERLPEPELPRNLMKIEVVPLIFKKTPVIPTEQPYKNSTVKNFKKFKKVYCRKVDILPKIVGAHELIPHDKIAAQVTNEEWDDPSEEVSQPIRGAFDWDAPTV